MFFSLEALKAKKGDALLVHYGTEDDPTLLVIDGGPSGVYRRSLQKRLVALRAQRTPGGSLPIRLLMVSHIDDDHIKGVLDLTRELREQKKDQTALAYRVQTLWHNSFDDIVGNHADAFATAARDQLGEAAISGAFVPGIGLKNPAATMVVASVPQGRQLRDDAKLLEFEVNTPFDSLVMGDGGASVAPAVAEGLEIVVVGPSLERVTKFQEEWDKELKKRGLDQPKEIDVAAYLDRSVWNLASIVVLLRAGGKEILLTGDGRGDYILEGMQDAGLLENGKRHVDILKLPHHGSSNNVEPDFFETITADHYVISGDGSHGNPNVETFKMIFDARRGDRRPFKMYLTYEPQRFKKFHGAAYPLADWNALVEEEAGTGRPFQIVTLGDGELSATIDLLAPFE